MLLTIWAGVGYYAVIFLAGLQNIPEELYDAAQIDGCGDIAEAPARVAARAAPADRVRGGHLEPRRAQGLRRDLRPDQQDRRHPRQRRHDGVLPLEAGVPAEHAGYASAIAIVLLVVTLVFSIVNVRLLERRAEGEP